MIKSFINEHIIMNRNKVFLWLKDFKYTWLPQNILNDTHLIELISTKLHELEQLLNRNNPGENGIFIESENQCDTEPIILSTEQHSLPTPPNVYNQIDDGNEKLYRPAIRLKRISLAEAENFLPTAWKTTKSKVGRKRSSTNFSNRKKNTQTNKLLSSKITQDETVNKSNGIRKSPRSKKPTHPPPTTSVISIQSTNDNKKKTKRKLRAIDAEDDDLYTLGNLSQLENSNDNPDCQQISRYIGQNGLLSQTRKINETTYDDDFTITLHSRQSNRDKTKISNTNCDIITIESDQTEAIPIDDDVCPIEDEQIFRDMMENHDPDSLFTSLERLETSPILNNNSSLNYDDCIEDITNDGIDPPPPSSSSPNFDHLSLST